MTPSAADTMDDGRPALQAFHAQPAVALDRIVRLDAADHRLDAFHHLGEIHLGGHRVNAVALACLEEALADETFVEDCVAQVTKGRDQLTKLCAELGLRWWPSRANFVLARIGPGCGKFVQAMARRGVQVRDQSSNPGCDGCVRITVGTADQMNQVLTSIRDAIAEARL